MAISFLNLPVPEDSTGTFETLEALDVLRGRADEKSRRELTLCINLLYQIKNLPDGILPSVLVVKT